MRLHDSWLNLPPGVELVVDLIIIAVVVVLSGSGLWLVRKRVNPRASALLSNIASQDMYGSTVLKTPEGVSVLLLAGRSPLQGFEAYTLYMAELPFVSEAHILGLPNRYASLIRLSSEFMEPVTLEGDYPDYFALYADKNQQMETRYVLDPKAMVFTIDFCKDFYWEIQGSSLYFIGNDATTLSLALVDQFIDEIRPSVERPTPQNDATRFGHFNRNTGRPPVKHDVQEYRSIPCPLCHKTLIQNPYWHECSDGHGCLATGKQMRELREVALLDVKRIAAIAPKTVVHRPKALNCPYCRHLMVPTKYQSTAIVIDLCNHCGYRWFDPHELQAIL